MPKERIYYIDAIKAICIVLMITMHVPQHWPFDRCFWSPIAEIFCMAAFFAMSGYTTEIRSPHVRKRLRLLIPFLLFGVALTLANSWPLSSFFTTVYKNGYWFLWLMVVFAVGEYVVGKLKANVHMGFLLVEIIFVAMYLAFPPSISHTLSLSWCVLYWPFIYLGQLMRSRKVFYFITKRWGVSVVAFIVLTAAYHWASLTDRMAAEIVAKLYAVPIITLLFIIGYQLWGNSSAQGKMEKAVSTVGQGTLQIYTLHFFFLEALDISSVRAFTLNHTSWVYDLTLTPIISLMTAILCIIVANVMYRLRLGWLFGR